MNDDEVILTWGSEGCKWVAFWGGGFVIAIAWTHLYLGAHYPSDIVAGWLVLFAWAIGVSLIIRPQLAPSQPNLPEATSLNSEELTRV
jgi:undecaprenyl-diphosphatase